MSYILEALRKSERERRANEVPALPTLVAEPPPRSRSSWLSWLVAGLLLFNAVGLSYLWMNRRGAPAVPAGASSRGPAPAVAAEPAGAAPVPPGTRAAAAADVGPSTVIVSEGPPSSAVKPEASAAIRPRRPVQHPEGKPAPRPAGPQSKSGKRPEEMPARPIGRQPAPGNERPAKKGGAPVPATEERLAAVRPPVPEISPGLSGPEGGSSGSPRRQEDIPLLRAMPTDFRDRVPEFRINIHAYSKEPAERFAIIDMKKYLVGDRIPGGALLREVRADSLVLDLDGTKFRVPRP